MGLKGLFLLSKNIEMTTKNDNKQNGNKKKPRTLCVCGFSVMKKKRKK